MILYVFTISVNVYFFFVSVLLYIIHFKIELMNVMICKNIYNYY